MRELSTDKECSQKVVSCFLPSVGLYFVVVDTIKLCS